VGSLHKFSSRRPQNGHPQSLFWHRADVDGAPFRGLFPPMYTEEEYDERVVRVVDAKNGFFDVSDAEQNKKFLEVMDACYNGWFQCVFIQRFLNNTMQHYVEWIEYYLEDGTRTPFLGPGMMELAHGQSNLPGPPGPGPRGPAQNGPGP
jgi:hypothetical protein